MTRALGDLRPTGGANALISKLNEYDSAIWRKQESAREMQQSHGDEESGCQMLTCLDRAVELEILAESLISKRRLPEAQKLVDQVGAILEGLRLPA